MWPNSYENNIAPFLRGRRVNPRPVARGARLQEQEPIPARMALAVIVGLSISSWVVLLTISLGLWRLMRL